MEAMTIYYDTQHGVRTDRALWQGTDLVEALKVLKDLRREDPWSPTVIVRERDGAIYRDGQWTEA